MFLNHRAPIVAGFAILLACFASTALAQQAERLGTVSFPAHCKAEVQPEFEHAVALLHSFAYEEAEPDFAGVFRKDPHCAIALWGEAMSIYHPLWFQPSPATLKQGRELIEQAQSLKAGTQRERDYIDALGTFYERPDNTDYDSRTAAYATSMARLAERYPQDHEAAIFYALSLLAAPTSKSDPLANRLKAAEILMPLYRSLPDHPGVAHYLIHACDTPKLAERGLPMAQRYAQIAPSAAHAVHMPAHIFTLLGMWREDIASNLAAEKVSGGMLPLHFLDFLSYAYLQVGDEAEVQKIIDRISSTKFTSNPMMKNHAALLLAELPARYALEMRQWSRAASLPMSDEAPLSAKQETYWARTIGAARAGDLKIAQENLKQLEKSAADVGDFDAQVKKLEAKAWVAYREHRDDEAMTALRQADQVQENSDTTAHDWMGASALEMLADLLLQLDRPAEAFAQYQAALRLTPNRLNALYGAGLSASRIGKKDEAATYYKKLLEDCEGCSSTRPEITDAKEYLRRQNGA